MFRVSTIRRSHLRAVALGWCGLVCSTLSAQAPILVDPDRSVFLAFPSADSYRVIERDVDAEARKQIEARVPFRVHYDELDKHSLYVALRGKRPLGVIYVQNEESTYGLATVEWDFSFDLRVSGFRFQRVRSKHRRALEQSAFVRSLKGRTREGLIALMNNEGELLAPAKGVHDDAQGLARTVVRSGVKSLVVLDVVWRAEIDKLRDLSTGLGHFPRAHSYRRLWPLPGVEPKTRRGESCARFVLRALDRESKTLGVVFEADVVAAGKWSRVQWTLSKDLVVTKCSIATEAPAALRIACREARRRSLDDLARRRGEVGRAFAQLRRILVPSAEPGK